MKVLYCLAASVLLLLSNKPVAAMSLKKNVFNRRVATFTLSNEVHSEHWRRKSRPATKTMRSHSNLLLHRRKKVPSFCPILHWVLHLVWWMNRDLGIVESNDLLDGIYIWRRDEMRNTRVLCWCIQHPRHWPNCREWFARYSPACSGRLSSTSSC